MTRAPVFAALVAAMGCGGSVASDGTRDSAPATDSGVADSYVPPDVADSSIDLGADATCLDTPTPLSSLFAGSTCTATVHVSSSATILGWSVACGTAKPATEADARAAFAPYVAPYTTLDSYMTVGGSTPNDEFVFYKSPGDFGGMGVVSWARGDVLLAAELAWMGPTKIDYPPTWRPADEIVARCSPTTFERLRVVSADGAPIDDASLAAARNAVETSLVPVAIVRAGMAIPSTLVTNLQSNDATGTFTHELLFFVNTALLD